MEDFSGVYPLSCIFTQARLPFPRHTKDRVENCHALQGFLPGAKGDTYELQGARETSSRKSAGSIKAILQFLVGVRLKLQIS